MMKLTYFQLASHLLNQLASIYVISGNEIILKNETLQLIRKKALQMGFSERLRLTQDSDFNEDRLYSLLYSTSLLQEKRLIELDFRDRMPNKIINQILENYSKNPSKENILLIDTDKIDVKISKSLWFQSLPKTAVHVAIWPLPHAQLPQWIIKRAQKYKLNLSSEVAKLIADHTEGNLIAVTQHIEKLYLLKEENAITTQTVKSILNNESCFTVFDFIESLIARDLSRTLYKLAALKNEGAEPILLLWGITRELRLLTELAGQIKAGITLSHLFQTYHIYAQRQSILRQWLTQFTLTDCYYFLTRTIAIDKVIKGAVLGNAWQALQLFCCEFTGHKILSPPL